MRTQRAPLKGIKSSYRAAETTVVVLVCIPSASGYYEERLRILKVCLSSILNHTDEEYDLMVIDNGSIKEVTDYLVGLEREGYIRHLILNSANLGLSGALNVAFNAAPGRYIAFSNDDVFFHPGWLSAHIEVFNAFPEAGIVSGQVVPGPDRQDQAVTALGERGVIIKEFVIPDRWVECFAHSVGISLSQYLSRSWADENRRTYILERNGVRSYSGKTGYAHVFRKDILREMSCFPFETGYLGGDSPDRHFAQAVGAAGKLWLCTYKKKTEHMGNKLSLEWVDKLRRYSISLDAEAIADTGRPGRRGLGTQIVRHSKVQRFVAYAIEKLIALKYH